MNRQSLGLVFFAAVVAVVPFLASGHVSETRKDVYSPKSGSLQYAAPPDSAALNVVETVDLLVD